MKVKQIHGFWQRFSNYFSAKLGFLWDVLVFVPNLVTTIIDIIESFTENWSIQIPDLTIPAMTGVEEYTFFEGFSWSPYTIINSKQEIRELYELYLNIIDFFVYWGLVWYGIHTVMKVFGNSDETIQINN